MVTFFILLLGILVGVYVVLDDDDDKPRFV